MSNAFLVTIAACLASTVALSADTKPKTAEQVQKKYADERAQREKARKIIYDKLGGLVCMPDKEPGIRFMNCQTVVPQSAIETCVFNVKREFEISCFIKQGAFKDIPGFVADCKDRKKFAATVALVDDPTLPQMLCMPDNGCAIVNVRPLMSDKPKQDRLNARAWRSLYRAFAIAMGGAWSMNGQGIMKPGNTLDELDANQSRATTPETHFAIQTALRTFKVEESGYRTYQQACFEGWAHMPTNAVQKQIWEDVKSGKIKEPE